MLNLINFDILAFSSAFVIENVQEEVLYGWFIKIVFIVLSLKYSWYWIKQIDITKNWFCKKIHHFFTKIRNALHPVSNDLRNVIFGWLGVMCSWSIASVILTTLYNFPAITPEEYTEKVTITWQQLEFAHVLYNASVFSWISEVILVSWAFWMLMLSPISEIFKLWYKVLGVLSILLIILTLHVWVYAMLIIDLAQ